MSRRPMCGCLFCGPLVGPILLTEFTRICIRLHSKPLTHIGLFNAMSALRGRTWSQAMWWMRDWCPPPRGPHLFSTRCMPSCTPHSSLSRHSPPISQVRTTQHAPPFQGGPLPPCSPGSGLGGRCGLGLTKVGQHGGEVQDEQLHLWVPSTASHVPAPECPVPPSPQPRMLQSRGWG